MKTKQNIKPQTPPAQTPQAQTHGVTHADRKKWWTNYNASLVNRISEIKKFQS